VGTVNVGSCAPAYPPFYCGELDQFPDPKITFLTKTCRIQEWTSSSLVSYTNQAAPVLTFILQK
jgi:hypothetical protein